MKAIFYKKGVLLFLIATGIFSYHGSSAQLVSSALSAKEKSYAKTIINTYRYLKSQPAPVKRIDTVKKKWMIFTMVLLTNFMHRKK